MRKERVIFHMDGDAFFVACEVAKNPKLKGLPVVTGQERGIVSALSYEAKALGIKRGMPIFRVKQNYPNVLILPGDYRSYASYSEKMFDIVRRYIDDVEEYSIDECFGDLTGLDKPLRMPYKQIAERIKNEVTSELGLSVSVGVAPTKVLAKVASKWVKPNGLTIIEKNSIESFLEKTEIEKIWGIGGKTTEFLKIRKIFTAKDFVDKNLEWVRENLSKPYEVIWEELRGNSVLEINKEMKTDYSSIQKTKTFHPNTNDRTFLFSEISKHIESACAKARHYNLVPKTIAFFLKTKDFRYMSIKVPLVSPTNAPEVLVSVVRDNFYKIYKKGVMYRTTGVTLLDLAPAGVSQMDLFGSSDNTNKFETIHKQIDDLESKFGKKVIHLGSTHKALKRKSGGTDMEDLDRDLLFL